MSSAQGPRRLRFRITPLNAGLAATACLALIFVLRCLLASRSSYWLDELLSVSTYGIENKSATAAIRKLARASIHPPLYQAILYYWMRVFGHDEAATRLLSNLYVTGAGVCVFLLVRRAAGARRGVITAVVFSCMQVPFFYALETRSYGQSLFLSALSSWALFEVMRSLESRGWKQTLTSGACVALVLANFGLLMTHYYNAFFLAPQGLFGLGLRAYRVWPSVRGRLSALALEVSKAAALLVLPLVLQLGAWGSVMARSYRSHSGQYTAKGSVDDPFTGMWKMALDPNFQAVPWIVPAVLGVLLVAYFRHEAQLTMRGRRAPRIGRAALAWYALVGLLGPFTIASALFSLSAHERYSVRYFSYTAPALALLLVLAVEQAAALVRRSLRSVGPQRFYLRSWAVCAVLTLVLVLPGTYVAATKGKKGDWRGVARTIVDITSQDPSHRYIVFATGFTTFPSLDYYFERFEAKPRVAAIVRLKAQKKSKRLFDDYKKRIARHDYLILTFAHHTTKEFPNAIALLGERYALHEDRTHDGRGLLIYRVKPAGN